MYEVKERNKISYISLILGIVLLISLAMGISKVNAQLPAWPGTTWLYYPIGAPTATYIYNPLSLLPAYLTSYLPYNLYYPIGAPTAIPVLPPLPTYSSILPVSTIAPLATSSINTALSAALSAFVPPTTTYWLYYPIGSPTAIPIASPIPTTTIPIAPINYYPIGTPTAIPTIAPLP